MALIERLMLGGNLSTLPTEWLPKGNWIPVFPFQATLGEYARGRLTGAQAQAIIESISDEPLSAEEVAEAQAILATITSKPTPEAKLFRVIEVEQVLTLAETKAPGYDTPELVEARLGV